MHMCVCTHMGTPTEVVENCSCHQDVAIISSNLCKQSKDHQEKNGIHCHLLTVMG